MDFNQVEQAWSEIEAAGLAEGLRSIDSGLPFRVFATIRGGRRGLFVGASLGKVPTAEYFDSHGLTFSELSQADLKGYLLLGQQELQQEFRFLLVDLLNPDRYSLPLSAKVAMARFVELVSVWKLFFKKKRTRSLQEVQGVFGELTFLCSAIERGASARGAFTGWKSPDDEPVDFRFSECGVAVEVKTALRDDLPRVTISSLEQLGDLPDNDLYLVVIMARSGTGESIGELVRRILVLIPYRSDRELFRDCLVRYGFTDDVLASFENVKFEANDILCFGVEEGFPRICRADCHTAIRDAKYILDLTSIPAQTALPLMDILARLKKEG